MKQIGFYLFTVSYSFLVLTGCVNKEKQQSSSQEGYVMVQFNDAESVEFSEVYDFYNADLIRFKAENLKLSDKLELTITDYIFLLDKSTQTFYRFDLQGNFLNMIGKSGKGPGEFLNSANFFHYPGKSTIDILSDNGTSINTYDLEGNFISKIEIPVPVLSFASDENGDFIVYSGYFNPKNNYRLNQINRKGEIIQPFLPIQSNAIALQENNFTINHTDILFRESYFPEIYRLKDGKLIIEYVMDFGSKAITMEMLEKVTDPVDFFQQINQEGFRSTVQAFQSESLGFIKTIEQGLNGTIINDFIVNRTNNKVLKVNGNNKKQEANDFFSSLKLIKTDKEGNLFFLTNPIYLLDYYSDKDTKPEYLKELGENDNPFLLKVPVVVKQLEK